MNCPLDHATLVRYWAGDLSDEESEGVEDHLFSCDACFEAVGTVAGLATALRDALPPIVLERDLERARLRGTLWERNDFLPGEPKEAWMRRGIDILIHRLVLEDPGAFDRASVEFETLDGEPLFTFADVPVDRDSGAVLIACQRHFTQVFPEPDVRIRVRGKNEAKLRRQPARLGRRTQQSRQGVRTW